MYDYSALETVKYYSSCYIIEAVSINSYNLIINIKPSVIGHLLAFS